MPKSVRILLPVVLLLSCTLGSFAQQPDENNISEKYRVFIAPYQKTLDDYIQSHPLDSTFFSLFRQVIRKKLEFIKKNKDAYFSFMVFKNEISRISFAHRDDLIDSLPLFYESTFPGKFRQSEEGKQTEANLHAIMVGTHDQIAAPDFTSTDIRGNTIRLDDYKGRYVLLNLWATWCGPCMAELPAIVRIRERYPADSLVLISVSCDSDSLAFLQAISKYKMDWTHIYKDQKLAELYGTRGLPMLFLIDKTGTIIYNRAAGKETDPENLSVLNEVLKRAFSR